MRAVAGDFNHDGKDDIGVLYDYTDCHAGMFRFLSTGSGLVGWPARTWFVTSAYAWCAANTTAVLPLTSTATAMATSPPCTTTAGGLEGVHLVRT
ncbi:hypothetical protein HDA40_002641 [Hamadaea flava]|uniref:VCBS repeat-containing protein n=1 Tax=Hamadaea flava TaxID=1742688 RepID=A0ABV8LMI3_9ACTN|nr:hypothetical protein [Hamadaea flava]MCP2324134.1 hypothetical protein [Hamadaea flava]